ncbi:MAG: FHA domain-containing protein [Lachnospiraceae bacterium]|nr:FHA domain-containing protein [Lachnospiraceae bacterium]
MNDKISLFEDGIYKCLIYETDNKNKNNISINHSERGEIPYLVEGYFSEENNIKGEYNITDYCAMMEFIPENPGRDDVFLLIRDIINALDELRNSFICESDVLLKKEYIYIEKETKTIKFIGVPVILEKYDTVYDLILDLLGNIKWKKSENKSYLNVIAKFILNRDKSYSEIIDKINDIVKSPVEYLKINNIEYVDSINSSRVSSGFSEVSAPPIPPIVSGKTSFIPPKIQSKKSEIIRKNTISDIIEPKENIRKDEDMIGETTVLGVTNQPEIFPVMIRLRNNDRVIINKDIFLIGKEQTQVDYCISDNSAISRVHAKIICKNGEIFIKDNNSTNHIFVNGMLIDRDTEVRLSNGAKIRLGNEEFEFRF